MSEVTRLFNLANEVPSHIHVMLTTKCSLGCKECFYKSEKSASWSMKKALRLIAEAKLLGIKWLAFGGGEPTEWPMLGLLISRAHSAGLKVAVTTNGVHKLSIVPDAIHVSHDRIHCGSLTWRERTTMVAAAIRHYRILGVAKIGINTLLTDATKLAPSLLKSVDRVVLLLPKPLLQGYPWQQEVTRAIRYCKQYTEVLVDSCLSTLMGRMCWQGRNSMAFDAQGKASICSNIKRRVGAKGIMEGWKKVRLRTDTCPQDCIVRSAIDVQRQHTGLPPRL